MASECPPPELLAPKAGETVSDVLPVIAVRAVSEQRLLHLSAEVRIPEKEILQRFDSNLPSNALQLPILGPLYRADLKLALTATCGGGLPSTTKARFHVDTGLACPAPSQLSQADRKIQWRRERPAERFEVALFDASGREVKRTVVDDAGFVLGTEAPAASIAVVRSRCAMAFSAPAFLFLR